MVQQLCNAEKVRASFSLLSCDTSQEPDGNCSEKHVKMNLFILGEFYRVDFPPLKGKSRERKISPKFFRPKFSNGCPRVMSVPKCLFPGFGGPDRSFWPDVRRDLRPKTSSLG